MESDEELKRRILAGDRRALRELVQRYERLVQGIVLQLLPDRADAEEVCQDVFLRVYRGLPEFRGDAKLSTWIGRIAHRTALKRLARHDVRQHATAVSLDNVAEQLGAPSPNSLERMAVQDLHALVRSHVAALPSAQRVAITLYHLEELGIPEIARIQGVPVNTVKSHLFRGRRRLKEMLEEHMGDYE